MAETRVTTQKQPQPTEGTNSLEERFYRIGLAT